MRNMLTDFFNRLHSEDYSGFVQDVWTIDESQLWQPTPDGVSVANLLCHVLEMERFWIDWGFNGRSYDRNRDAEFTRFRDVTREELIAQLEQRRDKTQQVIAECDQASWDARRIFHGDEFTGATILQWHIHHLGLHRGHVQAHCRWLHSR